MGLPTNEPVQKLIVDFLKAGGAELLTDEELNCALAVLEDDEEQEQVEAQGDETSTATILERIRKLKAMEEASASSSRKEQQPSVLRRSDTKPNSAWGKWLLALAASVLVAFTAGLFVGSWSGRTGTLVADVSSEQVTLRGGEDGLKLTVRSPHAGFATLVLTGSAPLQVLPNVDAEDVPVSDAEPGEFEIRPEGYETAYVFVTGVPADDFIRRFVFDSPPSDARRLREAIEKHLHEKGFEWVAGSSTSMPAGNQ